MSDMICGRCHRAGIRWFGLTRLPYTECPNCGGINCQRVDEPEFECERCEDEGWVESGPQPEGERLVVECPDCGNPDGREAP